MTRYTADVRRDGRAWLIHVPELDRSTQARHLREVEEMARDLVAVMTDVEPDSVDLDVTIHTPDLARQHLAAAERLRDEATRANARSAAELRAAARTLRQTGMPLRDIGQLLGVSYQRAGQLVA